MLIIDIRVKTINFNCLFLENVGQDESSSEPTPDLDSDYNPSDASEDDQKKSTFKTSVRLQERITSNSSTKCHISDYHAMTEDGDRSQDQAWSHVTVKSCVKGAKRKWDKRHYCVYCKKPQSKMSKHLIWHHRTEKEAAQIVSLPPKSKTCIQILEKLRKKGDYYHNINVLQEGKGEIVTYRQPSENANAEDFLPCNV